MRVWVQSLASLGGLRIGCCCEVWCRSKTRLGSGIAMAVEWAGSWSSNLTASLGTSMCCRCGPKKKKKKVLMHLTHTRLLCHEHNSWLSSFFSFFLPFLKVLLKYSWFTTLWSFLLYNKVIQLYTYTRPFFFRFFPHIDYPRILGRVSVLYGRSLLTIHSVLISVNVPIPNPQSISPPPMTHLWKWMGNHLSLKYIINFPLLVSNTTHYKKN